MPSFTRYIVAQKDNLIPVDNTFFFSEKEADYWKMRYNAFGYGDARVKPYEVFEIECQIKKEKEHE